MIAGAWLDALLRYMHPPPCRLGGSDTCVHGLNLGWAPPPTASCRGPGRGGTAVEQLRKEAALMAGLRHPNIVMFLGACSEPPCMVTEYCARGSLLDILTQPRARAPCALRHPPCPPPPARARRRSRAACHPAAGEAQGTALTFLS